MAAKKKNRPLPSKSDDGAHHPAHKSNQHQSKAREPIYLRRRAAIASVGLAAAATAFKANIAVDYLLTERAQFRVTTPDNDDNKTAANRFPGKTWYLLGGFGVSYRDTGRKLEALQRTMNERAPASYIGYSNGGIDIAQLFIAIQRDTYERKIDTVYFYGDSFGGMAAVVLASLLEENGIHVKIIVMGSSPSNVRDVLDPGKEYISLAGRVVPYLGVLGRIGAGVWSGLSNPNGQGMYEAARSGINSSFDGLKNSLILDTTQATFLQSFPAQYDGNIPHSTGIGLLYDPEDFIVNARLAIAGWKTLFVHNSTFEYDIPHTGHASPEIHPDIYRTALTVILDKLDPPPLTTKPIQSFF
ncbi:hypothetical protein [Arthrobacter cryoconiti]|uniref:Uncharacterized protein n=1 Tax=Arthrobacter cryoconiti TaxID=748907 RepID=A0ABV8R3G0_9MICC|nr:hypothetical protein [Arthrobacter cryoconiti]MCC9066872.1 hypothetical protein [Arthrobacter cryoconiti]